MAQPITVSDDGTIWSLHLDGVEPQSFAIQDDGVISDLTDHEIIFRVNNGPTIALAPDPENIGCVVVAFTLEDLDAIPKRGAEFYIKDLTNDQIYLEGEVFTRGFR